MIRNLGQVAAIYIGSSAPRNTNLIWLDNTVVPFVFRAYDGSAWSEIATHKWVRAYVDGWLVTLPPRQLADDGDYMLINSNNVNYKITVKDFVKSAVGNPLDFKGVIRVSADFPNPSTLEAGDMYVIITSPVGGTVTDPYSGKTFEDSEKIVWDEVTRSWESLGKINITVNLTTSYSETEVTIHSSAGKETTIQGATDQLAGVMLPGQYSWLQALSNGSIVPGDPSSLTPLTPAHKHNYGDIINRLVSQQETGESTIDPMSQKATTDALNLKFDKASVLQVSGAATDKVMSQKAVTDALKTLSDDFNNKLTNYLPLTGGTMKGNIRFPIGNGIACNDVAGTAAYVVLRTWNANNSTRMYVGTVNFPTYISSTASDLIHDRNGSSYLLWDSYNLTNPVTYTTNTYNHATLTNKDGQYFTYIKAGTNGLLPHSKATLVSGGSGSLGTSDQSFNAAYINNLHTNKVTFGETGPYITGSTSAIQFLNAEGGVQKVATGGLYVGPSYASDALNLVPASGIYSQGNIRTSGWLTFEDNEWTDTGWAYKDAKGSIKVLSVINEANNKPTSYGSVLQFNSRQGHWCTQIWCDQTNVAGVIGTLRFRTTKSYNSTEWNPWTALVTEFDLNSYLTKTEASTLYYPYNGRGYLSITSTGKPVMSNNQGYAVKDKDGNEREVLWMGTNNALYLGNTSQYTLGQLDLRCTTLTHNGSSIATQNYVTNQLSNYLPLSGGTISSSKSNPLTINSTHASQSSIDFSRGGVNKGTVGFYESLGSFLQNVTGETLAVKSDGAYYGANINSLRKLATVTDLNNYLPLTGGTLSGQLIVGYAGSTPLIVNNSYTNGVDSILNFRVKGVNKTLVGYSNGNGPFIQDASSNRCIMVKSDGAYFGTGLGAGTKLALITDIPTVSGYLPLSGGTLTGALTMNNRRENVVVDVVAGIGNDWNGGAGALSVQVPSDNGQTPLLLARRSGAAINTTTLSERLLDMALLDTGTIFKVGMSGVNALELEVTSFTNKVGIGKLFGKQIATTDQIPSIPSISISNSGSGNAVTSITASGHTLTVTKGATYLTSHQTIYDLTFQAGTFSAKTFDPNGAAATVNIPTKTSHITNDSGFITSSALSGYATQSWANGQFAPLSRFNTSTGYTTIKVIGQEFNFDSATPEIYMNYRTLSGSTAVTKITWKGGSNSTLCEGRWGNLYMNDNLVATQSWVNSQNFVKSTSTKKVTDIQPVDVLPATQASGVLYLVFG